MILRNISLVIVALAIGFTGCAKRAQVPKAPYQVAVEEYYRELDKAGTGDSLEGAAAAVKSAIADESGQPRNARPLPQHPAAARIHQLTAARCPHAVHRRVQAPPPWPSWSAGPGLGQAPDLRHLRRLPSQVRQRGQRAPGARSHPSRQGRLSGRRRVLPAWTQARRSRGHSHRGGDPGTLQCRRWLHSIAARHSRHARQSLGCEHERSSKQQ